MGSHQCNVRGILPLKDGVTNEALEAAFKPLCIRFEISYDDAEIVAEDGKLDFSLDIWGEGGYQFPEVDQLAARLGPLVASGCYFELFDYETGDSDAAQTPYFIGADRDAIDRARLAYGFAQMQSWVEPIVGPVVIEEMKKVMEQNYIPY